MDVSIAVSLIRGQMGTVVERAVNGAVETVLAEMLKVVGVKFEELKAQVVLLKRDIMALQREKALKEKENDNIRAKLRYTELKLKYYRQGVEEEFQQRTSAATLVRIHPSTFLQAQRGGAGLSSTDSSPSRLSQSRTTERALMKHGQECTSPQRTGRRAMRVSCHSDVGVPSADSSDLQLPVSLSVNTPAESLDSSAVLFCPTEPDTAKNMDNQDDCEWTITLQPHSEGVDTSVAPPHVESLNLVPGQQPEDGSLFPDSATQADSSLLPPSAPQVKQEAQQHQQEKEVICIKEEPGEEQEVTATLLLDCQVQQEHLPESGTQTVTGEWSGLPANHTNHTTALSSAAQSTYPMHQMVTSAPSMVGLPQGIPPRQAVRPWTKDLSLYEEYKLRRNELRRRNLSRRRELEKTLPQPLLADLVRERREKTRLRVARWRAKRKLQACLNQAQAQEVAAGVSQTGFTISSQHQELTLPCASTSSSQQGQSSALLSSMSAANISTTLPFKTSTSSSSLLRRGPSMSAYEHTVTSSSSYPQVSLSQQSISLVDTDILQ
ncbi:uncharacterized protein si:ch211-67e16.4 [Anabas testudineus]|uniref:uncharacterized protein si:ch211-67e16.4 n=1 Tax=Anabas testudineus TaxID=64144 RepID=UPI000E455E81|nr:uncharacterized protein si:ch211-67e16.4 [Anabas testudineus]XP_026231917.1 uncharacterized protein si:ch211-67e16.4 [Anabas testudineus]